MKRIVFTITAFITCYVATAQTGNFGIGTNTPGSKITVNGSFAASYKLVSSSYTMDATDYYVAYDGNTNGTLTLPAATTAYPAAGNIKGRVYYIKNTGTANLTIAANGSELIDNQSGLPVSNIGLGQGWFAILISEGTTGNVSTWEAMVMVPNVTTTIVSMAAYDIYNLPSAATFNAGTPQVIPFAATDLQVNQGSSATWNTSTNSFDINETGIYELDAFCYWKTNGTSGSTYSWIGANMAILKNGTAVANSIAGTRSNVHQAIAANSSYNPMSLHCIVNLTAGDKLYMTLYRGAGDNGVNPVSVGFPAGLAESRHFSLKKL